MQDIYRALTPADHAAVVMPDNVLFEGNTDRQIRIDLMDKCNLHSILRLPTGIFYAQGVKTNVRFFTRGESGRIRRFTRDWIAQRDDNLDIAWLKDDSEGASDELPEPAALAQEVMGELEGALDELRSILVELGELEAANV